jgi:hypothetical protein
MAERRENARNEEQRVESEQGGCRDWGWGLGIGDWALGDQTLGGYGDRRSQGLGLGIEDWGLVRIGDQGSGIRIRLVIREWGLGV